MTLSYGQRRARGTYIVLQAAWNFLWPLAFTLSLLYQVEVAQLSALQLVLVGTVLEATCFLGEIPTGIVADLHSRKLSVIIGLAVMGSGIATVGLFPSFWPILAAQVIWGLGYTFVSGAAEAWVTDEVGAAAVQPVFTKAHQVALACSFVGTALAGACAMIFDALQAPIIMGGLGFVVLSGVMVFLMQENGFRRVPQEERSTFSQMRQVARTGLQAARRPGVVRVFLVVGLLTGLTSEVFDRLWVDRIVKGFLLPPWFGEHNTALWFTVFALVSLVISLVASLAANWLAPKAVSSEHPTRLMAALALAQAVGVAVFALAGNLGVALGGRWLRAAAASVGSPIRSAWLNRNVESSARATTGSMMNQADALGQVAGGPALGAVAGIFGVPVALMLASAVQAPTAVAYLNLRPRDKGKAVVTDETNQ